MKRMWMLALSLALVLCGCAPTAREPDQLALVRVLGVAGSGPVELTAVCGLDEGEDTPVGGTCEGVDFAAALEKAPWCAKQELTLTSVSYLVVGADVNLHEVLVQVLGDEELGSTATVWVTLDPVGEVLEGCSDPEGDLTLLTNQGIKAPTVAAALATFTTQGQVELPCVGQSGGRLEQTGWCKWEE